MGTFKLIVALILVVSFMVFVAFFGRLPALRRTPIASLHRLIWVHIPKAVLALDQALTGGRISGSLLRFGRYLMNDRHWTVVIFFGLILSISEYLYVPAVWPEVGLLAKLTTLLFSFLPYLFLYLACSSDPGYVTPENHAYHLSLYPYDHTLFHPGHVCKTCNLLKPPRSKHCSICKKCIARADHHCIFINSCVGYGNHHWFLLLLLSTGILTLHGSWLGTSIIVAKMKLRSPRWTFWPAKGTTTLNQYLAVVGWGIQHNVNLGATTLLAVLTSPLVWGLFLYTMWLVYCGTTTNESLKWSEWKEDMADGFAFRRSMPPDRKKDGRVEPWCKRWPVETEQILVTTMDGQPPPDTKPLSGTGPWERVWNLKNVENLYDLGFWDNLTDVFVKDCSFGSGVDEPIVERRRRNR